MTPQQQPTADPSPRSSPDNGGKAPAALSSGALPAGGLGAGDRAFWGGLVIVVLSLISGLATYLILTGLTPIAPRNDVVLITLLVNVVLILAMLGVLGLQAAGLWRAWQRKEAGARIHVRIVGLFTLIAAAPALLLALAATVSFSRSIDNWFSTRTRTIVASSIDVARAYLDEHGQVIRTDVVNMAKDLDDLSRGLKGPIAESTELRNLMIAQTGLRDLSVAVLVDRTGQPLLQAAGDTRVRFETPSAEVLRLAEAGQVPLILPGTTNRVAALARLESLPGHYLYVARSVNPRVLAHLSRTEAAVAEYERLRAARGPLRVVHGVMYFMISLTGTLAAIWCGLWFAGHLVAPIRRLIDAAQRVARGDLTVVLPLRRGEGDLRRLSKDFNMMTRELHRQRSDLVNANAQLDERRRFMEAVLSGVSAGVIGLDADGRVRLANPSAERLLARPAGAMIGKPLADIVPEFAAIAEREHETGSRGRAQAQVSLMVGENERTFDVRITREQTTGEAQGSVVTFDDITELVTAQRTSAWGDVARRIAHEIKNPLTPIQLSAERIRRKWGASIGSDRETFEKLTDTIVRQVGDIKNMVDEFASFARVPKPQMAPTDIREAVQEPMIQFRETHPAITYVLDLPAEPLLVSCDGRLLTQALTNLVKNATESVETVAAQAERPADWHGRIEARVREDGDVINIEIIDNGTGLPRQNRSRLLEPYVTTKGSKGTGLGLAIVQKIVEQHGGSLVLDDAPPAADGRRGALVRITLPSRQKSAGAGRGAPDQSAAASGPVPARQGAA